MGVIGYIPIDHPSGRIDIPIVGPGESVLPSRVRARRPSIGELSLVYPEDIRASPVMARQGGVTYAVAQDPRAEIQYAPNRSVHVSGGHPYSGLTSSVLLARTYFNRVTRVEANLTARANSHCSTWDVDAHYESTTGWAWIRVVGPTTSESAKVSVKAEGHHPGFASTWETGWWSASGSVAIDVPPGTYEVYLYVQFTMAGTFHSGSWGEAQAICSTWKEIARG